MCVTYYRQPTRPLISFQVDVIKGFRPQQFFWANSFRKCRVPVDSRGGERDGCWWQREGPQVFVFVEVAAEDLYSALCSRCCSDNRCL